MKDGKNELPLPLAFDRSHSPTGLHIGLLTKTGTLHKIISGGVPICAELTPHRATLLREEH